MPTVRSLLSGVVLLLVVVMAADPAAARCGADPGDADAVQTVVTATGWPCGCCRLPGGASRRHCALDAARTARLAGALPRRCFGTAVRAASRSCRSLLIPCPVDGGCLDSSTQTCTGATCSAEQPCPGAGTTCSAACRPTPPSPTTTLPGCATDAQCDDGNACTRDVCVAGACEYQCQCLNPVTGITCCPGPGVECPLLRYFQTCGDIVCRLGGHRPHPGVPACTTQRLGQPCVEAGSACDPGDDCNALFECTSGRIGPCPISRRSAKRDIRYLSDADGQRVRDALLKIRLATYEYRGETCAEQSHLGFIIDDLGASPAVNADGTTVDLYGYTSMAVAAIQAQAREIEQLRHEVEALRRTAGRQ